MIMLRLSIWRLVALVASLAFFIACATTGLHIRPSDAVFPEGVGHLLETDHQGHFLQVVIYDHYYNNDPQSGALLTSFKYLPDGTFEEQWYEATSSGAQSRLTSGSRGRYSFRPATLTMTRNIQASYMRDGTWGTIEPGVSERSITQEYFTERNAGAVFARSNNKWIQVSQRIYEKPGRPPLFAIDTTTSTYKISEGLHGYSHTILTTMVPPSGKSFTSFSSEEVADSEFVPAGSSFVKGNSVRIKLTNTHSRWQGGTWRLWDGGKPGEVHETTFSDPNSWTEMCFSNLGEFMIETPFP